MRLRESKSPVREERCWERCRLHLQEVKMINLIFQNILSNPSNLCKPSHVRGAYQTHQNSKPVKSM
jgi:hypothetical protein